MENLLPEPDLPDPIDCFSLAMANHLVLTKVLDAMDLANLKLARLVCRDWDKEAAVLLKQKSCLRLRQFWTSETYHLTEFLFQAKRENGEYFVDTVVLEGWQLEKGPMIWANMLFFDLVGPCIREIILTDAVMCKFSTIKNLLATKMQQVERLTIKSKLNFGISFPFDDEEEIDNPSDDLEFGDSNFIGRNNQLSYFYFQSASRPFAINWKNFFLTYSNLKEFHAVELFGVPLMKKIVDGMEYAIGKFPQNLRKLEKLSLTLNLDHLYLGPEMNEAVCTIYSKLASFGISSLKELAIVTTDSKDAHRFMASSSHTLESLKIQKPLNSTTSFTFPMRQLKKLEIQENLLNPFDYLQLIPTCKILTLDSNNFVPAVNAFTALLQNVNDLPIRPTLSTLNTGNFSIDAAGIEILGDVFPTLKSVSLHLTDVTLRVVLSRLRGLERLEITGGHITDEGILGIGNLNGVPLDQRVLNVETDRIYPYIGDLKKLREFVLRRYLDTDNYDEITDCSVRYGLMDLKELRFVSMPHTKVSYESIVNLRERIAPCNIDVSFCVLDIRGTTPPGEDVPFPVNLTVVLPEERVITVGSQVIVFGYIPHGARRFAINLGPADEANVALHFNPRWDEGVTIFNTMIDSEWGPEEKFFYNEMYYGMDVMVQITCQTESFLIQVNKFTPITYRYKVPLNSINAINVNEDIGLYEIYLKL